MTRARFQPPQVSLLRLGSLTPPEWHMATQVESMRPGNNPSLCRNREKESEMFESWAHFKGLLSAAVQAAEGLIHEARTNEATAAIVTRLINNAKNFELGVRPDAGRAVGESVCNQPWVLAMCSFRSEKEQKTWTSYADLRHSDRGRKVIALAVEQIHVWRSRGYDHVTPGMIMDPVRLHPAIGELKAVFDTAVLLDLDAMGEMPEGFVETRESMWRRMPRIMTDEKADKVTIAQMGDRDDLFE